MLSLNKSTGEIFLYGAVGASWYEDSFTSVEVIDALNDIGNKRAIVRINSPGGVADEGIAIYNAIKRHKAGADTHVDALAASAASVIALAGETRTTSAGARWMIHRALTIDMGNATQLRKTADTLETYDRSLVEIYSEYLPEGTDVMALLDAETWYTGPEAVAAGLSTSTGGKSDAKPTVASWFKNPPAALIQSAVKAYPGVQHWAYAKAKQFKQYGVNA
jgi:ATP-dependent protease ClpP protease subunit